jgi:dolichyl-diphosphooligosaccharide--protein glycosyltransferase/undecaprenyl-diphosphooligosaccharide--protein glycosyltransferase
VSHFIQKYLYVKSQEASVRTLLFYVLFAYLFSVAVRLILFFQTRSVESFWLNGDPLPIWSPDAGLYGFYAKQLLAGHHYPYVAEYMPGHLIASIVSTFGFNIDWVMFLLPAFLSSLVVIPTVLMGYALKQLRIGFLAALIAGIGINFYTRSHLGYMDTDILNLFFPYMAIVSFILALQQRSYLWGVLFLLSLIGFHYWYHSSLVIIAALVGMALLIIPIVFKNRLVLIGTALVIIVALFSVDSTKIIQRASDYVTSSHALVIKGASGTYHFTNTLGTVAEAVESSLFKISPVLVATEVYFALALLGYLLLVITRPIFLMALPLVILGVGASELGMRFSMFATPILAFGFIYLLYVLQNIIPFKKLAIIGTVMALGMMLYNILLINATASPYFFKKNDVITLKEFAKQSDSNALIYSWWDYGWPLWYYTGQKNTLVDNGRHGSDTYLIAKLLLSANQNFVANASRYFSQKQLEARKKHSAEVLPYIIKTENLNDIFQELNYNIPVEKKDRATYLMLHRDMFLTFKTLEEFATTDLDTGNNNPTMELYISDLLKPYSPKDPIIHGDTFKCDLRNGIMMGSDGAKAQVNGIIISNGGKIAAAQQYNKKANYILIIYNNTKAIYLDMRAFKTFLVQALLLDRYDKSLFTKVVETQKFKILKLR